MIEPIAHRPLAITRLREALDHLNGEGFESDEPERPKAGFVAPVRRPPAGPLRLAL